METPSVHRRRGVVLWSMAAVLLVCAVVASVVVHLQALGAYDAAADRLRDTVTTAQRAAATLTADADDQAAVIETGRAIAAELPDDLTDPAARDAFAATVEEASAGDADARAVVAGWSDDGDAERPVWTWDLFAEAAALDDRSRAAEAFADDAEKAGDDLAADSQAMTDASATLYTTVPPAAAALETANVSAQNLVVLDFRDAAAAAATAQGVDDGSLAALRLYADRADTLRASQASELAEKQGPQLAVRLEIEAYARSIAGGVVLDFDWAPTAAGIGGSEGIGGTATWNAARGGYSTITFSYSVADWWPNADARALVTHEVGHAITAKCSDMFDWTSGPANEEWATAWAIGMGHTAEGNGVQAYGYPSQDMIDRAMACR